VHAQPKRGGEVGLKRIAALAGDRIALVRGIAVVNGTSADEPYADVSDAASAINNVPEAVVPPGYVFLLGENRDNSEDSRVTRTHGLVPLDNIVAAATYIVWSPDVRRIGRWIGAPTAR
jgi:signal peptidase I